MILIANVLYCSGTKPGPATLVCFATIWQDRGSHGVNMENQKNDQPKVQPDASKGGSGGPIVSSFATQVNADATCQFVDYARCSIFRFDERKGGGFEALVSAEEEQWHQTQFGLWISCPIA